MAFIRNQERMVYQTVYDYVRTNLDTLGWLVTDPAALPFGATTVLTLQEESPDPKLVAIAPNTVAFSEGTSPDDKEAELGAFSGGLWTATHTFFIDVYGESIGVAKALSSDIRAILAGRLEGTTRYIALTDYSLQPPAAAVGHLLHFEDIQVDRPMGAPSKIKWEVVKVTCIHEFNAVEAPPVTVTVDGGMPNSTYTGPPLDGGTP